MRILVATDAWRPQVNGVVRTYERLKSEVEPLGASLSFLTPAEFKTLPLPTYPEIRLARISRHDVAERVAACRPHFIHIATEGPIGLSARRWCLDAGHPYTTSYHTRFPDYLSARLPVPLSWGYSLQRWFHNTGVGTFVSTRSLAEELEGRGFRHLLPWTRGVDASLYRPRSIRLFGKGAPVYLYAGRVAVEKNLEAFLELDLPGAKVVVGDGPQLDELQRRYPAAIFTGPMAGEALAHHIASADVFVFPSRTDTFGIVQLEAMACGVPVAAFPVTGPIDVVVPGVSGALDEDLRHAVLSALRLDRAGVRSYAEGFSWSRCAELFVSGIVEANAAVGHRPSVSGSRVGRVGGHSDQSVSA